MSLETTHNSSTLFYQVITDVLSGGRNSTPNFVELLEEISLVAAQRAFNDDEFTLLLNFLRNGPMSHSNKSKLLSTIVPCSVAPSAAVKSFLAWFISNYRSNLKMQLNKQILQWIISLLDHDLVEPSVVNIFYYDYIAMLKYKELVKHSCKLLCKLTHPQDVTLHLVKTVAKKYLACGSNDEQYLLAVLNVFQGYKPHLTKKAEVIVKKVNVKQVMKSAPQKIDFFIKLRNKQSTHIEKTLLGTVQLPLTVHDFALNSRNSQYKISSLMPVPTFDGEGVDKIASIHPSSIEGAFHRLHNVPIPEDLLSLLRDNVGFFLLMYRGKDIQTRFSGKLLHTLQEVFIQQDQKASDEDKEFLLTRVYELQMFMQQGLQCVSIFLAGYLLRWDGLDHRFRILSLIEWATYDSFQELSSNILRPLYLLFVSYDVSMKKQILQSCTKLISNMFIVDLSRAEKGLPCPFLDNSPRWTSAPITMLQPLVAFVEGLIKVGMCLHPGQLSLLLESIHFYETMSMLEFNTDLPMWTVISHGLIGHSLFNIAPVALNQICKLLLRYHTEFLPRLRERQPQYYSHCADKINLTSKYCQELINLLWNGQAMSRNEDGLILKEISDESLASVMRHCNRSDIDKCFDVEHNLNFLPHICLEREKNGPQFLKQKTDFLTMLEFHLEHIAEFIKQFSSLNE